VFAGYQLPTLDPGLSWDTSQLLVDGDLNVVPEPGSLALAVVGCLMLGWMVGFKRRG
jgi:hypothetical protein